MYEESKDWSKENQLYAPKRNVSNRISWKKPHIIGEFYSSKMLCTVQYESLNECFFYFLLELCKKIIRYYVQPVKIPITITSNEGRIKNFSHVPDVLIFRYEAVPMLCQIKESLEDVPEIFDLLNRKCHSFAEQNKWSYNVFFPKQQIPETVLKNIRMLVGFTKKRPYYDTYIPEIIYRIRYLDRITITEISRSFISKTSPLMILPIIYHLVATDTLTVNMFMEINENSEVTLSKGYDQLSRYFTEEKVLINEI